MGLDTSHNCWHGAYSAFHRWRMRIATAAGVPLPLMEGFYQPPSEDVLQRTAPRAQAFSKSPLGGFVATRDSLTAALADAAERGDAGRLHDFLSPLLPMLPIKWAALKDDPINVLLSHSDCEGEIAWSDCGPLADRLEALLPLIGDDEDFGGHVGNVRKTTQQFIDGLRSAAAAKEDVDFH